MKVISVEQAQASLQAVLDEARLSHEPIQITSESANGVLLAEADWRSIQETLYLLSIPGMRESIREGMQTPPGECAQELPW